ncbi:hypothetical protein Godav_006691 [Gossypium davidsonii]|uniref:Uncharacterized protein n=2 Tax=Gossypium TaxID=3633 RepID=A0A7J8S4J1_GOSDV|nr:hypothetical protein [Gossypium davidsonii]
MVFEKTPIFFMVVLVLVSLDLCFGSELGMSPAHGDHGHHHHCDHGLGHDHHHHHRHVEEQEKKKMMLPEELAEEEDMKIYGFGPYLDDHDHDHDHHHQNLSCLGGAHSHSHDDHGDHAHHTHTGHDNTHAHSLKDLSVGLSVLDDLNVLCFLKQLDLYNVEGIPLKVSCYVEKK